LESSIKFNGATYSSVDQMPPEVRAQYEKMRAIFVDEDKNGIPDLLEARSLGSTGGALFKALKFFVAGASTTSNTFVSERIFVNGKEYNSLDDVPPEFQDKIREARASQGNIENLGELFKHPAATSGRKSAPAMRIPDEFANGEVEGNGFFGFILTAIVLLTVLAAFGVIELPFLK
jgi:hypothetical protein